MTWPRIAVLICGGGALLLLAWQWRQDAIATAPMTPIVFGHQDHAAVSCKTCHHNFFDDTGGDACYSCHKQRPLLAATVQRDFHRFCRDCHARIANAGYDSGPLRRCRGCHQLTAIQAAPTWP